MNDLQTGLAQALNSQLFRKGEVIQQLWSGYGEIARYISDSNELPVIVKVVNPIASSDHPRGWNTQTSHQRKLSSYVNERQFYQEYANKTHSQCRVPQCIASGAKDDNSWLIMEDLDHSGFSTRCDHGTFEVAQLGLRWLAHFHAMFLQQSTDKVWPVGTYWHLQTRPDEFNKMPNGQLKASAQSIDSKLNHAQYQTLVHGDAKLANFCFTSSFDDLAAVDFQYVGKGVGVKDVMYFLGSCFDEEGLFLYGETLVSQYFDCLQQTIDAYYPKIRSNEVVSEWRELYAFAWADFERFLLGWMPTHYKLNGYSQAQTQQAMSQL